MGLLTTRKPARALARTALLLALFCVTACATSGQRESDFTDSQLKYTQMVRWSDFDRAEEFVDPEKREDFIEVTDKLGGIRFIDYRIHELEFDADKNEAQATVIYSAYKASAPTAVAVEEEQNWRLDDLTKTWVVTSTFVEKPYESQRRD